MQLWTDYEGVTIDGAFPLKKLLLPEGRSAFFSTTNARGDQAFLRLIECHFDEEEILARWRSVEALGHPNFLKLERYGQLVIDGGTVVYAAFEKVDASLADVLARGRLGIPDTFQLAASLLSALDMLHIHGFVHEHVEARNVFAVGDVVKLRGDCIREAPEDELGVDAKRRDVHDCAVLLLQALTQGKALGSGGSEVPAPFGQIVRNGLSGAWGLAEMNAALAAGRPLRSTFAAAVSSIRAAVPQADAAVEARLLVPPKPAPKEPRSAAPGRAETRPGVAAYSAARPRLRAENIVREISLRTSLRMRWAGAAALLAVLALLAGWLFAREDRGHGNSAGGAAIASGATPARVAPMRASASAAAAIKPRPDSDRSAGIRAQWRVIVYTYNRREEAQKKSAAITQQHPDLRPEVFTPNGRAPYLVAIGGAMDKDAAFTLVRQSRSSGLPRDTYAQNY
jgi:hypothetical protein